jgi:GGDEF domain-containing protein
MKSLRIRAILLTCWLIGFYIMVHMWETVRLDPVIYLFVLVLIVFILTTPRLSRSHLVWLLTVPALAFFLVKVLMELPLFGRALPITLIETCAIIFTTLLLLWVRRAVHEFERAVAEITVSHHAKATESAVEGQSVLYREVRRARNHQRPLTLMAIGIEESSIKGVLDRMVKEAQQSVIRQFTLSSVSKALCDKLEDCDIVVQTNSHFLVVLPETKPEDLPGLMERLRKQVADQVGVDLKFGTASIPEDGFTFEGLLDKATLEMQASLETKLFIEPDQLFVKPKAQNKLPES